MYRCVCLEREERYLFFKKSILYILLQNWFQKLQLLFHHYFIISYMPFLKILFYLTLQYCIGFAIYQNESATGIHVFPILNPPPSSLPPPHTIPLGRPSAPAPSIQYRASNLDWQLVSYLIFYMFQCHSPKSSHPLPLPQSP